VNRLWIFPIALMLCGFTMIYSKHDKIEQVDNELNNMEDNFQDKQFTVLPGTPTLTDLQDHEVVIVSSNGWNALMWRDGIDLYAVKGSCVTVLR